MLHRTNYLSTNDSPNLECLAGGCDFLEYATRMENVFGLLALTPIHSKLGYFMSLALLSWLMLRLSLSLIYLNSILPLS